MSQHHNATRSLPWYVERGTPAPLTRDTASRAAGLGITSCCNVGLTSLSVCLIGVVMCVHHIASFSRPSSHLAKSEPRLRRRP